MAAAAVDAFSDRSLLTGTATQPPYEELEKRALRIHAEKSRLFVFWRSSAGIDCNAVGPATRCFCTHSYSSHAWYETSTKQVRCRVAGCRCTCFAFVPGHGGSHIRCGCKHTHHEHRTADGRPGPCTLCAPGVCKSFHSDWRCGCGETYDQHTMAFETAAERAAAGRSTEQNLGGWSNEKAHLDAACGGVTSMTSLLSGVERPVNTLDGGTTCGPPSSTAAAFALFDRRADAHATRLRQVRDGPSRGAGKSAAAPLGFAAGRGRALNPAQPLRPGGPPPRPQHTPTLQQRREIVAAAAEQRLETLCADCDNPGTASDRPTDRPPDRPADRPSAARPVAPVGGGCSRQACASPAVRGGSPARHPRAGAQPAGNARAKAVLSGGSAGKPPPTGAKPHTPRSGGRGPPSAAVLAARRLRAAEAAEARAAGLTAGAVAN